MTIKQTGVREPAARPGENQESVEDEVREEQLDRTIEDTFPASDPPSSIPDPSDDADRPRGPADER